MIEPKDIAPMLYDAGLIDKKGRWTEVGIAIRAKVPFPTGYYVNGRVENMPHEVFADYVQRLLDVKDVVRKKVST